MISSNETKIPIQSVLKHEEYLSNKFFKNIKKLVVTQFITLDGVIEDPLLWSFPYWTVEIGKFKRDELFASDAQLFGRVTYAALAEYWPGATDEDGYANRLNSLPKYVVTETLNESKWNNSIIINKNVIEGILKLKQQEGQDILVHGSPTLVGTLLKHGLVDQFNLLSFPLVLGKGLRLFNDENEMKLILKESKLYSSGVVLLSYQPQKT